MQTTSKLRNTLSITLFALGCLLGLAVAAAVIWADLEAALFDASLTAEERLTTLSCPVMMTAGERPIVSATFTNPTDREVSIPIYARFSDGFVTLIREVDTRLVLPPGETQTLEWEVGAEDIAFGRFILVRINALRSSPFPARQGSCGIFVINAPFFNGRLLFAGLLALSLLGMSGGGYLWFAQNRPLDKRGREIGRSLAIFAAITVTALLAGIFGWWIVGILVFAFLALWLGIIIERLGRT